MKRYKATGYTEYCPCHDAPTLVGGSNSELVPSTAKFAAPDAGQLDLKSQTEERNTNPKAIRRVVRITLGDVSVQWPMTSDHHIYFDVRKRILLVEYMLPDVHKLALDCRQEGAPQLNLMEQLICGWAIRLLFDLATLLKTIPLRAIALNGFVAVKNSAAEADHTALILSVVVAHQTLLSLNIDADDPRSTFHMLKGRLTETLGEYSPIAALVTPRRRRGG